MNRKNRRHPTHPLLPTLYPSKTRIQDKKTQLTSASYKGYRKTRRRV